MAGKVRLERTTSELTARRYYQLSYLPMKQLERVFGTAPNLPVWKTGALLLDDTRNNGATAPFRPEPSGTSSLRFH